MTKSIKIFLTLTIICFGLTATAQKLEFVGEPPVSACTTLGLENMMGAIDTAAGRNAANNDYSWENGDVIKVKFMNNVGSTKMRELIKKHAKAWETYANVTFDFVNDDAALTNMRIMLGSKLDGNGHNSYIGTVCNGISQKEQTMNLDTSDFINYKYYLDQFKTGGHFVSYVKAKRSTLSGYSQTDFYKDVIYYNPVFKLYNYDVVRGTTMHEFGHALGLLHEQSYPDGIKWNKDTVYKHYAKTQGWNKAEVDAQVLQKSNIFFTNGMSYDPHSIMHYPVYAWQTMDGFSVSENYDLSYGDKKIIAALYPKDRAVSLLAVPKIELSNLSYGEVKVDEAREGISIKPSFDLKTSAKLGEVYVVAKLTTEDGKRYIATKNESYNWNDHAATYIKMRLLPSSKISYNKNGKNAIELFFPFKELPAMTDKNVKIEISIYQLDKENNRYQKLKFHFLSPPLSLPTN